MIPFEQAYQTVMDAVRPMDSESVPLENAAGRVLAETVRADMPMPPYNRAMVDGYACRRDDLKAPMRCVGTVAAGHHSDITLNAGECVKIMTGAAVPDSADCVVMVEQTNETDDGRVAFTAETTADNITPLGKHIQTGDTLLDPGHRIRPPDVAVLASMGYAKVQVARRPHVGIIATGDELVEPGVKPAVSQIRNSNAWQLKAQVEAAGCVPDYLGIGRDNEASLNDLIGKGLANNNVLLLSGGVSMGDYDLVPPVLRDNGVNILFDRVALQPGKPTTFGVSDQAFVFGLPGNPVATYIVFELMVQPFLLALMGHAYAPAVIRLPLAETFERKSGARKAWVPVDIDPEGRIRRIAYHGSAHINALCHARGIIAFPEGVTELPAGDLAEIRLTRMS